VVQIQTAQHSVSVRADRTPLDDIWSLIARLDIVADGEAEQDLLTRLANPTRPTVVSFINQHALNLAWTTPALATALRSADVLLRDGVGLECCLRLNGCPSGLNMNGTDFIPKLARQFAGRRVALFGTVQPWTGRAASALAAMGCIVTAEMDGFRSPDTYVAEVLASKPALVILAMGVPKQEQVAATLAMSVTEPIVIVNGGAIADFLARRFPRAPGAMQALRMEWVYRLALEPMRLGDRYVVGGLTFAWRLMLLHAGARAALVRLLYAGTAGKRHG
jgi:exopolysaccharide biosynthesis WecB/TagA/CpsF family protein